MKRIHTVWVLALTVLTSSLPAADMGIERILLAEEQKMGQELIVAVRRGVLSRVEEILALNPSLVNFKDTNGWTPLIEAAFGGHTRIAQALLAAGADVNEQDNDGLTALMRAAYEGNVKIVLALLSAHADSTIPDKSGKTALKIAQEKNRTNIVELLQNHVDIEPEEETLMVKPAV